MYFTSVAATNPPPNDAASLAAWRAEKRGESAAPEDVVNAETILEGTVAGENVKMHLTVSYNGGTTVSVEGWYYYTKYALTDDRKLKVYGEMTIPENSSSAGDMELREYNNDMERTGTFRGYVDDDQIWGVHTNYKNEDNEFELTVVE